MANFPDSEKEQAQDWLTAFAERRCDDAFGALVNLYSGMVYASALRRTSDPQLAEEVVQDVFALLARKASQVRRHPCVTGWIYVTTRWVASDKLKMEKRRREKLATFREQHALEEDTTPSLDEALPVLDEALDKLKPADRDVVLWHYFDQLPYAEIGQRLGKSEIACRKQSSRALERLGALLRRRGYALPTLTIAAALAAQLGKAAPATLGASVLGSAGAASATITTATVIQNTIQTMAFTKTKTALVVAALAVVPLGLQWNENQKLKDALADLEKRDSPNSSTAVGSVAGDASQQSAPTPIAPGSNAAASSSAEGRPASSSNWPGDPDTFTIPRALLDRISVSVADRSTLAIGDKMKALLELTPVETEDLEGGLRDLRQQIWDHERDSVEVRELEEGKQVYFIPAFAEKGEQIRESIAELATSVLGEARAEFFLLRFNQRDSRLGNDAFARFGEYSRLVEFTHDGTTEDMFGVKTTYYEGLDESRHTMQEGGSFMGLPVQYRHLFDESFEEGE